jgi:hypothetical protein
MSIKNNTYSKILLGKNTQTNELLEFAYVLPFESFLPKLQLYIHSQEVLFSHVYIHFKCSLKFSNTFTKIPFVCVNDLSCLTSVRLRIN